jgi:hypothetical protein
MKRTMDAAAWHDGAAWLTGGWDGTYYFFDTWRSPNPAAAWHRVYGPTPPGDNIFDRRCYHHAVSFNGELHFFGGFNDHIEPVSKVLRDHWSTRDGRQWTRWLTPPWEAREAYGLVIAHNKIVLIGGVTYLNPDPGYHLRAFADVWAYDANGWALVNTYAPFGKRRSMGCAVLDDVIHVWGGLNSQNILQNDHWQSTDGGVTWTRLPDAPWSPRGPFHFCAASGRLWMLGGNLAQYGGQDVNDVWSYNPLTARWTQHPTPPWAGRVGSAVIVKPGLFDEIFLIGGMSGSPPNRTYYGDVWSSMDGDSWVRHSNSTLDVDP